MPSGRNSRWFRGARGLLLLLNLNYFVLSFGTMIAEGWNALDSLYYGMACLTTVGFGDLAPQTTMGRLLALMLIPTGITIGFGAGFYLLQDGIRSALNRRNDSMISGRLERHTIVCGFGRIGRVVARTLHARKVPICVVEFEESKRAELEETGIDYVIGNAMNSSVLERAGIRSAASMITTFDNDANNVYVVLEAREFGGSITIIATASGQEAARRLKLAGAHRIVSPAAIAGEMLAKSAISPDMIDIMSEVTDVRPGEASFGQVAVVEGSWIAGLSLADVGRRLPGTLVVMVKNAGQVTLAPGGSQRIEPGMTLVVAGRADAVKALGAMGPPDGESH